MRKFTMCKHSARQLSFAGDRSSQTRSRGDECRRTVPSVYFFAAESVDRCGVSLLGRGTPLQCRLPTQATDLESAAERGDASEVRARLASAPAQNVRPVLMAPPHSTAELTFPTRKLRLTTGSTSRALPAAATGARSEARRPDLCLTAHGRNVERLIDDERRVGCGIRLWRW
jgi:hypothetical protein